MMEAFNIILSPFVQWLGKTTVQASILICLILLVKVCLRRKLPVRWHYCLWMLLLVRLILPWSPQSRISIFNLIPQPGSLHKTEAARIIDQSRDSVAQPYGDISGTPQKESVSSQANPVEAVHSEPQPASERASEKITAAADKIPLVVKEPAQSRNIDLSDILPLLWLIGALVLAGYIFFRNIILWRAIKGERQVTGQEILELLEDCKMQMRIQTVVGVVVTDKVKSPALFGFVRPRLLLPQGLLEELDLDELQYVFLHELAHLKRGDIYVRWLTAVLQILHWFNPLIWLGFQQMYADQEMACDALAMSGMTSEETPHYGRTLVRLLERFSQPQYVPSVAGILEDRSRLERRMTMIAQFKKNSYQWSPLAVFLILILAWISLSDAQQPGKSLQSIGRRLDSAFSQDLITDPNTHLEFRKVRGITGSRDVIRMTYHGTHMDMSPNGRFLLCGNWIIPLEGGDPKVLKNGDLGMGRVRWSPDGTMIAFYSDGGIWVRPISQETGQTTGPARRLVDGDYWYQFAVQWSPDSKKLVYQGPNLNLHVVSVQDGTSAQITTGTRKIQGHWSPDGKWIAYNQNDDSIWVIPSEGGEPRKLADVAGRGIPRWTPDGQWVFCQWNSLLRFIRFSDGLVADVTVPDEVGAFFSWSPDKEKMLFYKASYVWKDMLRVISSSGGQPILPDVSGGRPMWTRDGRFIFTWSEYEDRYLYWVTPFGAGAVSPYPLLLDKPYGYVPGQTTWAQESLSPSREKLFFTKHTDSGLLEYWVIPISAARGTSTGPAMKVFDKGSFERDACWSPDESKIALVYGDDLWIAHADGSPPVKFTATADRKVVRRSWSPDGNSISWISHDPNSRQSALRIRSLSGDPSREIACTAKFIDYSWSPDGAWIAYKFYENESGTTRELFVVPATGGESRRLIETPYDYNAAFKYAWCPQGEKLALLCGPRLLLFDPASGQPQEVGTLPDPVWGRCYDMQWSPDGKTLGLVLEARPNSTHDGKDISGNTRLFTVTIPEGKWTELAGEAGTNYYFVWSPDGEWVAYNSEGWIRKRPEGVLWEVDVEPFLRRAAGEEAALAAEKKSKVVREIWSGQDVDDCGEISPDGRYLSYVDWDTGDLAVYEIATGKKRRLTNKGSWADSDEFAEYTRWSPDSRQIAYAWYNEQKYYELRLIGIEGAGEPRVLVRAEDYRWISPCDWSKDGKLILVWLKRKDGSEVAVVSAKDGSVHVVKEFDKGRFNNMIFSPEGNEIIYDDPAGDIGILSLKSGKDKTLVKHPANDSVLGWGPDGRYLLFASNRSGIADIWAIEVVDGESAGEPRMIKSGRGFTPPTGLGTTKEGVFYYYHFPRQSNVYITEIDPNTGDVVSSPHEAVKHFVGSNGTPDYSPDGKKLAYVSRRAPFNGRNTRPTGNVLCIRSLETGEEREIRPPGLNDFGFPRWSPDNRSVLVVNFGDYNRHRENWEMGLYIIDAETGETKPVVETQKPQRIHHHIWSADGKSIFLVRSTLFGDSMDDMRMEVVAREIASGEETVLLNGTWRDVYSISCSPDGKWLAVLGLDKKRDLRVIPVAGGQTRTIYSFDQGNNQSTHHTWSADGKYIFLAKKDPARPGRKCDLWRIPIDGGQPQSMGLKLDFVWSLSAHPDGRHITFSSQSLQNELPTVWSMENFLPRTVAESAH